FDPSTCQAKFVTAWGKIEAKGGCATTGDLTAIENMVALFAADVTTALGGTPPTTTTTTSSAPTTSTLPACGTDQVALSCACGGSGVCTQTTCANNVACPNTGHTCADIHSTCLGLCAATGCTPGTCGDPCTDCTTNQLCQ